MQLHSKGAAVSNRVDFYQGKKASLAVPAGRVAVLIEGVPCPYLEVSRIVRAGWPGFASAELVVNEALARQGSALSAQQLHAQLGVGKRVRICQLYNGTFPSAAAFSLPIFAGQIQQVRTELGEAEQRVTVTARDYSAVMEKTIVDGDGLRDGAACIEAIDCLLDRFTVAGQLARPSLKALASLAGYIGGDGLDIDGRDLLSAIHKCCEAAHIRFRFEPTLGEDGPEQAVVFYRDGFGRRVELNCQRQGEQLKLGETELWQIESAEMLDENGRLVEAFDARTLFLSLDYRVGDTVTSSPDSRDVFGVRNDNRSIAWIEKVTMDFAQQTTKLEIVRARV